MTTVATKQCIEQLRNLERCIRNQNSGADIHDIGNMRNTIVMLIAVLEDCNQPSIQDEQILKMIKNVEKSVVEFFKIKYGVVPR